MTATYAREITTQGCAKIQHVAFRAGTMEGHLEVLGDAKWDSGSVRVRCAKTGNEFELSPSRLFHHRSGIADECRFCSSKKSRKITISRKGSLGKLCPKCCGYSANRPKNKPCLCGKNYAPEFIFIDLDDRNPGNLAIATESKPRTEASCHPSL